MGGKGLNTRVFLSFSKITCVNFKPLFILYFKQICSASKGVTGVLGTLQQRETDGKRVKVKKGYPYEKKSPCPASSDSSIMNIIVIITILLGYTHD